MNKAGKPRKTEALEARIRQAQDVVLRTKARYEKATAALEKLLAVRRECQQRELMDALEKSGRTFEEVMRFLKV